jgi:hypothetical protein
MLHRDMPEIGAIVRFGENPLLACGQGRSPGLNFRQVIAAHASQPFRGPEGNCRDEPAKRSRAVAVLKLKLTQY